MKKEIAIIGFGNQAKAWALNLRDSNWKVTIGLRSNSCSIVLAEKLGFEIFDLDQKVDISLFAILTPDDTHHEIVTKLDQINKNSTYIYAHGFSLLYTSLAKEVLSNHVLIAPKAIASELRYEYEVDGKNGGVYSFEYLKDKNIKDDLLNLAKDLGLTSLHEATIEDETIADLFSEQSLLCSTLPYAAVHSFNKLRENGVSAEVAFFECWHEVKLIANTMVKLGPQRFFELISPNALIGSEIGKSVFFDDTYSKNLHDIFLNIKDGSFKKQLDKSSFKQTKDEVLRFWKEQELTHVHSKLEQELY